MCYIEARSIMRGMGNLHPARDRQPTHSTQHEFRQHSFGKPLERSAARLSPLDPQAVSGEVALWGSLLPAAVERARQTYAHTADCIYSTPGYSGRTLCSCGMGKDLPPGFVESTRSENALGLAPLQTFFYRAALSPLFPPHEKLSTQFLASGTAADGSRRCAKCGKSGKSLQCSRCRKVAYCSKECQRQDWKSHKPSCG